ncbi:putative High-affinity glucose transporter RGT2 [Glarea lozoyensis 74030]|nr:putative High-affinity glucose transporter RGT2 [Glarea lozoyensis 74030]
MVCQFAIPIILLIGAYFLPESPRWLLIKDRDTEAEKIMQWLRIGTHTEVVKEELHLIKLAIEQQRELHYAASYLDCFRGTNRRRTLIAAGVQCFQQFQGAQFILNYVYIFLAEIGVENTYQIGIYLYLVNLISAGCAFYMADKFGRRPILAVGALVMCASMFVVGGLAGVAGAKTSAQQNGALAALFVWLAFQAIAWGSCVWITCAEVGTAQLREKTITIATFLGFCSSILVTYVSPYLQNKGYGNLQGNIGFVWGGLSALSLAFVIFYVPELKGRSLEELDDMFQQKVSVFKFGKYRSVQGIGTIITQTEKKDAVLDKDAFSVEEKSVDPSVA